MLGGRRGGEASDKCGALRREREPADPQSLSETVNNDNNKKIDADILIVRLNANQELALFCGVVCVSVVAHASDTCCRRLRTHTHPAPPP